MKITTVDEIVEVAIDFNRVVDRDARHRVICWHADSSRLTLSLPRRQKYAPPSTSIEHWVSAALRSRDSGESRATLGDPRVSCVSWLPRHPDSSGLERDLRLFQVLQWLPIDRVAVALHSLRHRPRSQCSFRILPLLLTATIGIALGMAYLKQQECGWENASHPDSEP